MKVKTIYICLCFFMSLFTMSCNGYSKIAKERKELGNILEFNFVERDQLSSGEFYVSTEVNNKAYKVFIEEMKNSNRQVYLLCKPDDSLWLKKSFADSNTRADYYKNYFSDEKYDNHPVVCISKFAARQYIGWLNSIEPDSNCVYSLPTEKEFLYYFNKNSGDFSWGGEYWKNNNNNAYLANFAIFDQRNVRYSHSSDSMSFVINKNGYSMFVNGPLEVNSYHPNDFGLYNLSGNVAEMILDKTYTKGGSWHSPVVYLKRNSVENYDVKSPFVGFRVVKKVKYN